MQYSSETDPSTIRYSLDSFWPSRNTIEPGAQVLMLATEESGSR